MPRPTRVIAAVVGVAGLSAVALTTAGSATAALAAAAPRGTLTSQVVCDNGRFQWVKPLITHVTSGPGGRSASVSGRLAGLVPGHSYAVYGGRMAAPVPVGTASSAGTVSLSAVYLPQYNSSPDTDFAKYLYPGDAFRVEVSDLTDPSVPVVLIDAGRLAADRFCGHLESAVAYHQRVLSDGVAGGNGSTGPGYTLVQQSDGNLVYYSYASGRAVWSAGTSGHPGARTVMQTDGNLVVYSPANAVLFQTRTAGHPGASLAVQDDGNLVVYAPSTGEGSPALWQAGSAGRR